MVYLNPYAENLKIGSITSRLKGWSCRAINFLPSPGGGMNRLLFGASGILHGYLLPRRMMRKSRPRFAGDFDAWRRGDILDAGDCVFRANIR
jgi:hypothetical protein